MSSLRELTMGSSPHQGICLGPSGEEGGPLQGRGEMNQRQSQPLVVGWGGGRAGTSCSGEPCSSLAPSVGKGGGVQGLF